MSVPTETPKSTLPIRLGTIALILFRKRAFALAMFAGIYIMVVRLVPGYLQKSFYDQLTGDANSGISLWVFLILIIVVELSRMAMDIIGEVRGATQTRMSAQALMRKNILTNIFKTPGAQPLPIPTGDVINRMDDDLADFSDFPTWIPLIAGHGLFALVALIVMARIAPWITLVASLPLVGLIFLNRLIWRNFLRLVRESRVSDSHVTAFLGETFGAIQAMKVANSENGTIHYFHTLNERRRKANVRFGIFWSLFQTVADNMGDVAVAIMVVLAGVALRNGDFTVGDFALFSTYLFFLSRFPAEIGSYVSEIAQQRVVLDRLQAITPAAPPESMVAHGQIFDHGESLPAIEFPALQVGERLQKLEIKELRYAYPGNGNNGKISGIHDISLSVERGSFTVITGRIGAGKTTFLRLLLGLLPADGGEILWNGAPIINPAAFFIPPRAAYTPQVPRLFSERLRDNILLGLTTHDGALQSVIQTAVLQADIAQLEKGLDTVVGPRGVRLSGGQVQRAAVARMLARPAELLVLDDVSSALDVETEKQLWQGIRQARQQSQPTLLVVSHRPLAWEQADEILYLEHGRVTARGNFTELTANSPWIQALRDNFVSKDDHE